MKIPKRYIPASLTRKDRKKQERNIKKSRKLYLKHQYFSRPKVKSFHNKKSQHVLKAEKLYKVSSVKASREFSKKTGCSVKGLKQIIRKGEGAYYSSGSRPNQTAQSWGVARLASAVTGGNASKVDFSIIDKECSHTGKAYKLAQKK
jgi:hypothetical protein